MSDSIQAVSSTTSAATETSVPASKPSNSYFEGDIISQPAANTLVDQVTTGLDDSSTSAASHAQKRSQKKNKTRKTTHTHDNAENGEQDETSLTSAATSSTTTTSTQEDEILQNERKLRQALHDINKTLEELKKKNELVLSGSEKQELKQFRDQIFQVKKSLNQLNAKISELDKNPSSLFEDLQKQLDIIKQEIKSQSELKERQILEKKEIESQLKDLKQRVTDLKIKLPYTSIMDYEREISRLKQQLESKTTKQKESEIKNRIDVLEKAKVKYQEYYEMWEKSVAQQQRFQQVSESLDKTLIDLKTRLAKQEDYTKSLQELKDKKPQDDVPELKRQREQLRKQLQELKEAKQKRTDEFMSQHQDLVDQRKEIRSRIEMEKKRKQAYLTELDSYKQYICTFKIEFEPELLPVLIGKGGSMVKTIRNQSKADVNISKDINVVVIRGTKASAEMAKTLIENLIAQKKVTAQVRFKPEMVDYLSSQTMVNLKRKSGAAGIFADRLEGVIRIYGSSESVQRAKRMVEDFLANNSSDKCELPIPQGLMNVMFARSGENIRRIREVSGCGRVNVNTETNQLELAGTKGSIQAAKKEFDTIMKTMSQANFVAKVDRQNLPALIGKNGSNIRRMEEKTHAIIVVDKNTMTVTVKGSDKMVERAKKELETYLNPHKSSSSTTTTTSATTTTSDKLPTNSTVSPITMTTSSTTTLDEQVPQQNKKLSRKPKSQKQPQQGEGTAAKSLTSTTVSTETPQPATLVNQVATSAANSNYATQQQETGTAAAIKTVRPPTRYQKLQEQLQQQFKLRGQVDLKEKFYVGAIIGKQGMTIADLQKQSNCNIQVDKKTFVVTIHGNQQEDIDKAKQLIQHVLEQAQKQLQLKQQQAEKQAQDSPKSDTTTDQPKQQQ